MLHQKYLDGEIIDIGSSENLNIEKVLKLRPDIIFDYPRPNSQNQIELYEKLGIKNLYISEFYEDTNLGKAEWIKLFGLLFDKYQMSDSIFKQIERRYLEVMSYSSSNTNKKPLVISGAMYGESWHAPGGSSYSAELINSSGGEYLWSSSHSKGSVNMSFEKVFGMANKADVWIGVGGCEDLEELISRNSKYQYFKAFKNKRVYNTKASVTPWGANPYFEQAVVRPDLLLKDYFLVINSRDDKENLVYLKKLE
jgi:iron complex transport system substrate-binding protein